MFNFRYLAQFAVGSFSVAFQRHHLFYPAGMVAALELAGHKRIQKFFHLFGFQHAGTQTHHIGIVVLFGHFGAEYIAQERRPDALAFVGRQRHANARAADQNTPVCLPVLHLFTYCLGKHGIIHGFFRKTAKIANLFSFGLQKLYQFFFLFYARMIRTNRYHRLFLPLPVFTNSFGFIIVFCGLPMQEKRRILSTFYFSPPTL